MLLLEQEGVLSSAPQLRSPAGNGNAGLDPAMRKDLKNSTQEAAYKATSKFSKKKDSMMKEGTM